MLRAVTALYGVVAFLVPQRVIEFWEGVAFETTGDAKLRPGIATIARLEGLLILVSTVKNEQSSTLQSVLGAFGLAALLAPRQYLTVGTRIAYRNPETIEYKSWVVGLTRVFGIVFVVNAARALTASDTDESREEQTAEA